MTTNSFSYNGLDTRVGSTDSTGTKTFKRAGVGVTAPVLSDGTATFTPSGEKRGSTKTTFHSALKNADIQTNSSQVKSASKVYDAFGNLRTGSGSWKGQFHYGGQFGYQQDPDSGLKLLGHRYYDSTTGRFLTRDPIKDGRNWYVYCENSPVESYDSSGLSPYKRIAGTDLSYRIDASQKPRPNMHIYKNGKEIAVIDPVKGELPSHNGNNFEPLPKNVRKQLRKHTNKFQRKFGKVIFKRIPVVGALLSVVAVAQGQPLNEAAMDATPIVGELKFIGELVVPELEEYIDENKSGGFGSSSGMNSEWDPFDDTNW